MRSIGGLGYLLSLLPGLLVIRGNLASGIWAISGTAFICAICVLDWFVKDDGRPTPNDPQWTPDIVLALHVLLNTLAITSLLYAVSGGTLPKWRIGDATLSTGLNSGISGIVVAHELIHRRERGWRRAGIWNLFLVNFTHFYVEHVQGHHKYVGTKGDPSTARRNESIYHYLVRSIPQQFVCALRLEADRLRKLGRRPYGIGNFTVAAAVLQLGFAVCLGLALGFRTAQAFLIQGLTAVVLLQIVNYLQHYGLERTAGTRIDPAHSWQSDRISSRILLLELPRHADHHCRSTQPFHRLISEPTSPQLPLGLFGTIPLLLIPPVWFAVAHRLILKSQGNDRISPLKGPNRIKARSSERIHPDS